MRVYISGPMTGYPEFNYPEFHRVADEWRKLGHDVFCPAENYDGRTDLPWEFYMKEDIRLVMHCDAIVVLPLWWESRGALIEILTAMACGLPVFYKTGDELKITYTEVGECLREWGRAYEHRNQRKNEVGKDHSHGRTPDHHGSDVPGKYGSTVEGSRSDPRVEREEPGNPARPRAMGVRERPEPVSDPAAGTFWETEPVPYPGNM